jgi:hypothetical protein
VTFLKKIDRKTPLKEDEELTTENFYSSHNKEGKKFFLRFF